MKDRVFILLVLLALLMIIAIVVIRFLLKTSPEDNYKIGYSYIPKSTSKNNLPVIDEKSADVKSCIKKCFNSYKCNGITYNENNNKCVGYGDGLLVKTEIGDYGWEKEHKKKIKEKKMIIGPFYENQGFVSSGEMPIPYQLNNFMFSFFLTIRNWVTSNYGFWKCVFFKGSTEKIMDRDFKKLPKTPHWEEIVRIIPDQCIGVWLAPYTNNLRIAVHTQNNSTNRIIKKTEYFDIKNIPVNKLNFFAININNSIMEIYVENKLKYIINLEGTPLFNNGDMYIKNEPSFDGIIENISYVPEFVSSEQINKIYKLKQ